MSMRLRPLIVLAVALATLASAAPAGAAPARPFEVGFADSLFGTDTGNVWAQRTAFAGADAVRINVYWSLVAPTEPDNPRQSEDPAYDFEHVDRAVMAADNAGLDILMTVLATPAWAEGPKRPAFDEAPPGAWRPDADAYGDFAHAIAQRYSGFHPVPDDLGTFGYLPEVDTYAAWNEPNITAYLAPQFVDGENTSAAIYARLLNAFYDEIKDVNPDSVVSTGGTAPFGDPINLRRTSPLAFWRGVMCLTPEFEEDTDCDVAEQPRFDVLAHHPISYLSSPAVHAADPDDMTVADFGELGELRAAEAEGTVGPASISHRLIAPEIWWESKPGERRGISGRLQARYTALAMYLLWKQGADGVWFLQVRDSPNLKGAGNGRLSSYQTGIYTYEGRRKLVYSAIGFPFVTEQIDRRSALAWGKAPRSGTLRIQVKADGRKRWRPVGRQGVSAGDVFTSRIDVRGKARVRARIGRTTSLPWRQG